MGLLSPSVSALYFAVVYLVIFKLIVHASEAQINWEVSTHMQPSLQWTLHVVSTLEACVYANKLSALLYCGYTPFKITQPSVYFHLPSAHVFSS